jgi:hypothetical protein
VRDGEWDHEDDDHDEMSMIGRSKTGKAEEEDENFATTQAHSGTGKTGAFSLGLLGTSPTSVHIPERRRVHFFADNEFLEKPQWSSVAIFDPRSCADSDEFVGIINIKSRAMVEAEELQAWTDLKSKSSANAWRSRSRSREP